MSLPPSLDFPPTRTTLTAQEIAKKLACSADHILNLICDGSMVKGKADRQAAQLHRRVAIEDYKKFLVKRCSNRKAVFTEVEIPWPSIDYPDTKALTPQEIARVLSVSLDQIYAFAKAGLLTAYDLRSVHSANSYYRIPVEAYRQFINERIIRPAHA